MPPLNLLIKPASSLCNMRCAYCFYGDVSAHRALPSFGRMSEETLTLVIRRAFEYAEGSLSLAFQGGEPTLAGLDFYASLIRLLKTYNTKSIPVSLSMQTNGYLIDDEWAAFLAENGFLVGLSLDGTREAHDTLRRDAEGKGTYDRVVRAAEILERHGVEFNILCVVNRYVAGHPKQVYENLRRFRCLQFIPCMDPFGGEKTPFSLTEEKYADFLIKTFRLYCKDFMDGHYVSIRAFDNYVGMLLRRPPESCAMSGFCSCSGVVEGDGSVYPCDFYVLDDCRLGNVRENSFAEMFSSEAALRFLAPSRVQADACRDCRYFPLCRGGCRRDRETAGGLGLNRHCRAYKAFFDACLDGLVGIASAVQDSP